MKSYLPSPDGFFMSISSDGPVPNDLGKVRQTVIFEAARLLHEGRESNVTKAKHRAARTAFRGYIPSSDFPTDAEVVSAVRQFEPTAAVEEPSRWAVYESLLRPLERVDLPRRTHPEGDALYHSLQVFSHAWNHASYDEEFLTAALLHDVGWAIDPWQPTTASLDALADSVTERTAWLIEHLPEANARFDGTLGTRARNRLAAHPDGDILFALSDCDRAGRVPGAAVPSLHNALTTLRDLSGE